MNKNTAALALTPPSPPRVVAPASSQRPRRAGHLHEPGRLAPPEARVVILDEQTLFADSLSHSFSQLGYSVHCEQNLIRAFEGLGNQTELIVAELKIGGTCVLDHLDELRLASPRARLVIATAQPSIATAIRAVRSGVDAYLAKPVSAALVLQTLASPQPATEDTLSWPSLDRTIWEYLNHVVGVAGSLSEAARRLGLDRRSLRRMLAKYPPCR